MSGFFEIPLPKDMARNSYRLYVNRLPENAKIRKDMAEFYREERHKNPAIGRLVFKLYKKVEREMDDRIAQIVGL